MKTGTQMPVYVMGMTSSQTPFSFGSALPGLTFHWSTSKRDVLQLQTRHSEAFVLLPAEHNFAMSVHGRTKGRTGLKVVVKATDPLAGHLEGNRAELSDEIQIQVDDAGHLSSGSLTGSASLQVTSLEPFGINQTIIVAVKVVPVSYIRFSTSPVLYTSNRETLSAVPLGTILTFTVHFHDSTGDVLHGHNSALNFATNRDDLILVGRGPGNSTLTVRTVNVGVTLLGVWDTEQMGVADFLAVPVQHAIYPEEAQSLVVGDVICFSAQLVNQEGLPGTWSSSAGGVLEVDTRTGVGVARDSGTVTVFYEIPGQLKTYREVVVGAATKTTVMAHSAVVREGQEARVLVTTREQGTNLIGSCSPAQTDAILQLQPQSSISCQLHFSSDVIEFPAHEVFATQAGFDTSSGFYTCSISQRAVTDQQLRALTLSTTQLVVRAAVEGSSFSGEQISAQLPISPGLYADQKDLLLSPQHPSADLTVYGSPTLLSSLEVSSSSPAVLVQEQGVFRGNPSFARFTVTIADTRLAVQDPTSAVISMTTSPSSGQPLLLPVTIIPAADHITAMQAGPKEGWEGPTVLQQIIDSYQVMFFTLFALLAGTAIIVIACHAFFSPREPTYHPAFIQKTPPPSGLASPAASPFSNNLPSDLRGSPKLRLFSPDYNSR
ncbi:hypothetical protein AGOR_G00132450 [Albula goreensis]|uniref:Nucleoporin 210 n=1 Tax=Albula goreensis TaxID=1534307 RepID=A0A8T3D3Z7_9TELE|nr:hypothetical protein AGOR_G00132450 [Albula goreensis]